MSVLLVIFATGLPGYNDPRWMRASSRHPKTVSWPPPRLDPGRQGLVGSVVTGEAS